MARWHNGSTMYVMANGPSDVTMVEGLDGNQWYDVVAPCSGLVSPDVVAPCSGLVSPMSKAKKLSKTIKCVEISKLRTIKTIKSRVLYRQRVCIIKICVFGI